MSNNGNNMRGRYPPGIGAGGRPGMSGGLHGNPNFQPSNFQQQYVRAPLPNHQQQQQYQLQQHQQWLKKIQPGEESSVDEVEKKLQMTTLDSSRKYASVCQALSLDDKYCASFR